MNYYRILIRQVFASEDEYQTLIEPLNDLFAEMNQKMEQVTHAKINGLLNLQDTSSRQVYMDEIRHMEFELANNDSPLKIVVDADTGTTTILGPNNGQLS